MSLRTTLFATAAVLGSASLATAVPTTVNGDTFTLVATGPGTTQLFGLTSDAQGRVYAGNNSNEPTGIPVQRFDPALFSGAPIALQNFGPPVGDADGIAFGGGAILVADRDEGVRRIEVAGGTDSLLIPGAAINPTGSPLAVRPSDGHVFVGFGSTSLPALGDNRIDEYDALGAFVQTHTTVAEVETMTFDPVSGLIYYAPFDTQVRSFDPLTAADALVGNASGFIDGGLAFDPLSGLLFVGTANGPNSGLVETINPASGQTQLFASGFDGSLGILREPVTGDLFFLESNQLFRLESEDVFPEPGPGDGTIPEPLTASLLSSAGLSLLAYAFGGRVGSGDGNFNSGASKSALSVSDAPRSDNVFGVRSRCRGAALGGRARDALAINALRSVLRAEKRSVVASRTEPHGVALEALLLPVSGKNLHETW
jgi:hypothetical protein